MSSIELNDSINKRFDEAGVNPFENENPTMVLHPEYVDYKLFILEMVESTGFLVPKPPMTDDEIDSLFN